MKSPTLLAHDHSELDALLAAAFSALAAGAIERSFGTVVSGLKRALDFCYGSPPAQGTTGLFHLAILYQRFICDPRRKRRRTLL